MTTEKEAELNWCPFARTITDKSFAGEPITSYNRLPDGLIPETCTCIGSACQMWQQSAHHRGQGDCGLKQS